MVKIHTVALTVVFFLLGACSDSNAPRDGNGQKGRSSQNLSQPSPVPTPRIFKGDIKGLAESKEIRIAAPRFDGADSLPRSGLSVQTYQMLAEKFATEMQLNVKWVYVDGFSQLIPTLNEGYADAIVTNMTVTKSRSERVAFTKPIAKVSEVIVASKSSSIKQLEDLSSAKIVVPKGTAYYETLEANDLIDNTEVTPSNQSDVDILNLINDGKFDATVLDSDITEPLLVDFPDLEIKFTIKKKRAIAWAVRQSNPELLAALNEFLVEHHVKEASKEVEIRSWEQIKASGRLRMLTLNNPASYFMWRGELMGFDYELMRLFTHQNGLHLSVVIKSDISELIDALKAGEGDLIAASFTQSESRSSQNIKFTRPYLIVDEQIVGRSDTPKIADIQDLRSKRIGLNPNTVFYKNLVSQLPEGHQVDILEMTSATTEELIEKVVQGEFDYTVADSHLVALEKAYHQNIQANFNLSADSKISWAIREDSVDLSQRLNVFIKQEYRGLVYNILFNKYFKNERKIQRYQSERVFKDGGLSPYDDLVKEISKKYKMDWRLVTAQMYQESKFDKNAKSFAGAAGLMQVLPRTAKELGISDLYEPRLGITAGIAYMKWLEDRFPENLQFQERIFFTLAAYNAGVGHVRDARKLARKLGYDDNKWFDNVEKAMLLLSKPEYYKKARFGYVRGKEPVEYVRKIHDRYLGYVQSKQ